MTENFTGAKGAIYARGCVVTILRDDLPDLPWPGFWDLPGGGRDGCESAWQCFARETFEETGLTLHRRDLRWRRSFAKSRNRRLVFFGLVMPHLRGRDLRLGDEGQRLCLMPVDRFRRNSRAIPFLRARVAACRGDLAARGFFRVNRRRSKESSPMSDTRTIPPRRPLTLRDVSEASGVSEMTVSRGAAQSRRCQRGDA